MFTFAGTAGASVAVDFVTGDGVAIEIIAPNGEILDPQFVSGSELSSDDSGIRDL